MTELRQTELRQTELRQTELRQTELRQAELRKKLAKLSPKQRAILELRLQRKRQGEALESAIRTGSDTGPFPLSFAQKRLWAIYQLDPRSSAYHLHGAYRIAGGVQLRALERAVRAIVRRHEALRTTFATEDGEPVQRIAPRPEVTPVLIDLSALSEPSAASVTHELATQESLRPFDLELGPPFRFHILRRGQDDHVFLLNVHHIVADGWSLEILVRELLMLYQAFALEQPSPLAELPVRYVDFARWQRQHLQGRVLEEGLAFWKRQLEDSPAVLNLPTDRPRPAIQTHRGSRLSRRLPASLCSALQRFSLRQGKTLFMTLLAAFQVLLYRHTGQSKIPVGSPVANRDRLELENLIGLFVNMLVLVSDLSEDLSFRELLERVRKTVLDAHGHQHLPFDMLVEQLQPRRDPSYSPLFQVAFWLATSTRRTGSGADSGLRPVAVETVAAKFDLTLGITPTDDELELSFEYNTDLFDRATIARMSRRYQTLLEAVVNNPDARLSELPAAGVVERQALRVEWNDVARDLPTAPRVHEMFRAMAARTPWAVAVASGDQALSFRELDRRANRLAHYLGRLGVGPESLIGVVMERSVEMVLAILGTLKAGGAYVPFDPMQPPERLSFMLQDAGLRVLLTQESLAPRLPAVEPAPTVVILDRDWHQIRRESPTNPTCRVWRGNVLRDHLAYVIYTSGSTGRPKGTELAHEGLLNLVGWHRELYDVTASDRATQVASPGFDAAVWELWPYLTAGASIHVAPTELLIEPAALCAWLARQRITLSFLPTPLAEAMLAEPLPEGLALRALLTGGDRLHAHPARELPFQLVNHYGPTENTVVSTVGTVAAPGPPRAPSIGRPIANHRLYLLDRDLRPVAIGIPGELVVASRALARGYRERPALSAKSFVPDPFADAPGSRLYRTGDIALYRVDGTVEFVGRVDHQIKIRGYRIELGEIEQALDQHPAVRQAVVETREIETGDQRLVAYVVPERPETATAEELREALGQVLPSYMVPTAFVLMDALPLNANGKVDRRALPAVDGPLETQRQRIAPRNAVEMQLVQIWEKVLGVRPIGVRDDFFDLGGHSLVALPLMEAIHQRFDQKLPLSLLLQGGTIERLAESLKPSSDTRAESPMVALQPDGQHPPLVLVHPGSGEVLCYRELADRLGADRATHALEDPGLHGLWRDSIPIPDMATHYVEALRALQPSGPYLLAGLSFGGIVAFEMAQQLTRQGADVALVALLDAGEPIRTGRRLLAQSDARLISALAREGGLELAEDELDDLEPEQQYELILERMRRAGVATTGLGIPWIRSTLEQFKARIQVTGDYRPEVYGGRLALFRATGNELGADEFEAPGTDDAQDPAQGWQDHAERPIEVYFTPGNHATLCAEPNVRILAERLNRCIEAALGEP